MPLPVQRTFSASNKALRETSPVQAKKAIPTTQKSVSFSNNVKVQEIPHLKELCQEEKEATWYSQLESKAIKDEAVQVIKRSVTSKMEKGDCMRGLENRLPEAARQRKETKRAAFMVVWEIQEDQRTEETLDDDTISIKYQMQTINSREAAREVGLQDAKEAKKTMSKLSSRKSFRLRLKR